MRNLDVRALKEMLRDRIEKQGRMEREGDLPDLQCAMASLLYAVQALDKVHSSLGPAEFLRAYMALLENRMSRLEAEDAGEYGSGRDSIGYIVHYAEDLLTELSRRAA